MCQRGWREPKPRQRPPQRKLNACLKVILMGQVAEQGDPGDDGCQREG
jgi:hypothetical protein